MSSRWVAGFSLLSLLAACSSDQGELLERHFLVVVEDSLAEPLDDSLHQYAESMSTSSFEVHVEPWSPGTAEELRALIF